MGFLPRLLQTDLITLIHRCVCVCVFSGVVCVCVEEAALWCRTFILFKLSIKCVFVVRSLSVPFQMDFTITHTWDSRPVGHSPVKISFSPGDGGLKMEVDAPFFDAPAAPPGPPGQPFPGLWDYEGTRPV